MNVDVILGLQWGDEGKGKIVDFLAPRYDMVARFQGGPNAGHTLEFDQIKHVLHQVPSGIFRDNIKNVIGNGVVLDPVIFRTEVEALKNYNIDAFYNLYISKRAQLILPTHRLLDAAYEQRAGKSKIGSTLKGIGPTYQDKTARNGVRVGDLTTGKLMEKYEALKIKHENILQSMEYEYDLKPLEDDFFKALEFLNKFKLVDTEYLINEHLHNRNSVLAEGAQGSMLDIDFGSYPYVTSSNTVCAGVCTGLGIAPRHIGNVFGIFKAYCTRVGEGPFPTELHDEIGEKLRTEGHEFGATTGRPRRCGWIDLPALKYSVMLNGVTHLVMTKADVLNTFDKIDVCTAYQGSDGKMSDILPYDLCHNTFKPVFQSLDGWNQSLEGIKRYEDLPAEFQAYVEFLEEELRVPMYIISTGPNRSQTIFK